MKDSQDLEMCPYCALSIKFRRRGYTGCTLCLETWKVPASVAVEYALRSQEWESYLIRDMDTFARQEGFANFRAWMRDLRRRHT